MAGSGDDQGRVRILVRQLQPSFQPQVKGVTAKHDERVAFCGWVGSRNDKKSDVENSHRQQRDRKCRGNDRVLADQRRQPANNTHDR